MTNHNVVFSLKNVKPDIFQFDALTCKFENFPMGLHNGEKEWCVRILPPTSKTAIELFVKKNDYIVIMQFFDGDNNLASFTAIALPQEVASLYIDCYDELEQEYVTLYETFNYVPPFFDDDSEKEPEDRVIKTIEKNEIDDIILDAMNLDINSLLEDEIN